jgi:EAL domain-containing protein (putative c-di-GMP-specific phosphodiesterase class I)/GGDEF domain-containing protein
MPNFKISALAIPDSILESWQKMAHLLTGHLSLSSVFILRDCENYSELVCLHTHHNPEFKLGDKILINTDSWCSTVIKSQSRLFISDIDLPENQSLWNPNTLEVSKGARAYYGIPLEWPNGEQFGVMALLNDRPLFIDDAQQMLIDSFTTSIEAQITTIYQNQKLNVLEQYVNDGMKKQSVNLSSFEKTLTKEIDKRLLIEQQLHYQKFYDIGTGFLNRLALEIEAKNLLGSCLNDAREVAIIHIGFSNGRNIQSRFGHKEWELILKNFRDKLTLNNKSLIVLTSRPNSTDLALLLCADNIHHHVDAICHKLIDISKSEFSIDNQSIHLHTYIGVSSTLLTKDVTEMIDQASSAMISCKDSGYNFCYHSQALADSQSRLHQLENYLLHAVRNGDLMLYFQPKVCPIKKTWTGAEALLRWRHPILGDISSETLIHLAEKNGLIFEVGSFVLKTAIEKASQWLEHVSDFKMAVNVSAKQLKDVRFVDQVKQLLDFYKLPAHYLEIEVTESGLITDEKVAGDILQVLHELGVTLSLDDFGTGYASFNYLKKFPFDCIKIDKSFIHPLEHSEDDKEIVRSIIQVAKKLKLQVIIEGVETPLQEAFVVNEGCDFGQGFLYGHPMPAEDFEIGLIKQRAPKLYRSLVN